MTERSYPAGASASPVRTDKSAKPVFIVGAPRSGTMALWKALQQHPDLAPDLTRPPVKEPWFFYKLFTEKPVLNPLHAKYVLAMAQATHRFMVQTLATPSGRYVAANPYDLLCLDKIAGVLPEARFVVLLRHPQEVVWSMIHSASVYQPPSETIDVSDEDIRSATSLWKEFARAQINLEESEYRGRCMFLRHERLVDVPETVAPEILDFIGERDCAAVAETLRLGVINTSFPEEGCSIQANFFEFTRVDGDHARRQRYIDSRRRIGANSRFCALVAGEVKDEMDYLKFNDLVLTSRDCAAINPPPPRTRLNIASAQRNEALVNGVPWTVHKPDPQNGSTVVLTIARGRPGSDSAGTLCIYDKTNGSEADTISLNDCLVIPALKRGETIDIAVSFQPTNYQEDFSIRLLGRRGMYQRGT